MNSEHAALLQDYLRMMERTRSEIKELRATIDRLAPKAGAYDLIAQILGLLPRQSQGYGEDLVWKLDQKIKDVEVLINQTKDGTLAGDGALGVKTTEGAAA
ncbi:hypothetical protein [Rhizobium sp. CAU 1783]